MQLTKLLPLVFVSAISLSANESFNSEISHFGGGIVIAAGLTAVADRYYPEDRAMIGFGVSSAAFAIEEIIASASNGRWAGNLLDVAMHTAGSAVGAVVTDRYLLMPVISQNTSEGTYIGFYAQHRF